MSAGWRADGIALDWYGLFEEKLQEASCGARGACRDVNVHLSGVLEVIELQEGLGASGGVSNEELWGQNAEGKQEKSETMQLMTLQG